MKCMDILNVFIVINRVLRFKKWGNVTDLLNSRPTKQKTADHKTGDILRHELTVDATMATKKLSTHK
jgi:hypothetical protein